MWHSIEKPNKEILHPSRYQKGLLTDQGLRKNIKIHKHVFSMTI